MAIKVFLARTEEERERIYHFRYRVYVEELELQPPDADRAGRRLSDALDPFSISYGLVDESGSVLGSLRCSYLARLPDPGPLIAKFAMEPAIRAFGMSALATTSRFMLDPRLRHGMSILQLMAAAYEDGRAAGIRLNYGDCSPHMLPFYESMGYRRYAPAFNDASYGFKLPILMLLGDRDHFRAVRSPLFRLAEKHANDGDAHDWFATTYPDSVPRSAALMPPGAFLDLLGERVASEPQHAVALFRGLSREELDRFLNAATLVSASPGDRILREGERGDTVYILLKGLADVTRGDSGERTVNLLGAGDIFGEVGLLTATPRTASVIARAPCEVLVLSGPQLERFLEREPLIAARVLMNLSRILAAKLAQMTLDLPDLSSFEKVLRPGLERRP
jgi:hypothetical protein